jgi:ketosteroid isomerase-like protein
MKSSFSLLNYNWLLFLLCVGTANAQTLSTPDLSSVKKIIEERNQQYFTAIVTNDAKAFEAQFLEDGWIMVPGEPIYCGPIAIAEYFNEVLLKKGITRGRLITIDLYGIGTDVVAEVGFYQFYNKSNEQFDDGKFIVLWKRVNGQWKRLRQTVASSNPSM